MSLSEPTLALTTEPGDSQGKSSRKEMRNGHTTGRHGSARTAELLVFGVDGRGLVRGFGSGVSKTTLMATTPFKRKAEEEFRSRMKLQGQVDNLTRQMDEDTMAHMEMREQLNSLLSRQGSHQGSRMRFTTNSTTASEASMHRLSPQSITPDWLNTRQQLCELLSLDSRVVAYGRTHRDCEGDSEIAYKIVVDEIEDWNAELFGVRGKTYVDIEEGHTIQWLKVLTRFI